MRLDRIIRNIGGTYTVGDGAAEIDAICSDSRKVTRGSLSWLSKAMQSTDMNTYPELSAKEHARSFTKISKLLISRQKRSAWKAFR